MFFGVSPFGVNQGRINPEGVNRRGGHRAPTRVRARNGRCSFSVLRSNFLSPQHVDAHRIAGSIARLVAHQRGHRTG